MNDNNPSIESERRLVTVMFADIGGFTAMSEKLDPEEVTDLMNACFRMMEKIIEEHGGTIDKFIGDCVMALFGAPKAQENAPHRAIDTALAMKAGIQHFNTEKGLPVSLGFHIGINTGEVIAGLVGGEKRQDFTVMGDTVNLASRLESAAATGSILVSESTFRLTEGYFDFQEMEPVCLKGKTQPVKVYEVLGPRRTLTRIHAGVSKGLSPFTGRVEELALLKNRFKQAAAGQGQVVGIVGEPGVGKSRLIRHFRESLAPDTYTCIEGGCVHFGDAIPYLPILDLLKDCFAIKEQDDEDSSKGKIVQVLSCLNVDLDGITPPLHEILALKVDNETYTRLDAKERRDRTFTAIRTLLLAESRVRPLVVIIEDLHWIDKTSEELLNTFMAQLADAHLLLILLFRPEYYATWAEHVAYTQIRLEQLPQETSAELVQGILQGGTVEPELIDFITLRAEGNPLFIEELTWNLLENRSITKEQGRYRLALKPAEIKVPATIQGIIAARLDRLEGNLKKILQNASVIGREFAFRILQSIATLREDLRSSLFSLQDMEYIYEKAILPELEYIFKHALTQEVAYNSLLIKKRKETHARVGQAIEQLYSDRLEEFYEMLAFHYGMSEDVLKAYHFVKLSGDKAARGGANWEALRFYKEAIRLWDTQEAALANKQEKLQIYIASMTLLLLLGHPEGSLEIFSGAEEVAQELGDDKVLAFAYSRKGNYYTLLGKPELGTEYSLKSFYIAEKVNDLVVMLPCADNLCAGYLLTGDAPAANDVAERCIKIIEEHQCEKEYFGNFANWYSVFCYWAGSALVFLGKLAAANTIIEKGLLNAYELCDRWCIFDLNIQYALSFFIEGHDEKTIKHAQEAIRYENEIGDELMIGQSMGLLAFGYNMCGRYGDAREQAEKGLTISKKTLPILAPWNFWVLAYTMIFEGETEHAHEIAEEGLNLARECNAKWGESMLLVLLGKIKGMLHIYDFAECLRDIQQGIAIQEERQLKGQYAISYIFLGELYADAGRTEDARQTLTKAEALYREMQVTPESYWLARIREGLARLEA